MRDIVVIGGGLSGLAAAYELTRQGRSFTLIEVKPRLGGSINSVHHQGFVMDSVPMYQPVRDWDFFERYLTMLELGDAYTRTPSGNVLFHEGTNVLIDTLVDQINAPVMFRMAVSTLGRLPDGRFSICMENGMLLDANGLVVAAPARHAERIFHTLTPEISFRLLNYRYDDLGYISFGYVDVENFVFDTIPPPDYPLTRIDCVSGGARTPENGMLLQVGLRDENQLEDPVGQIATLMRWPLNPATDWIMRWSESDPLMWRDEQHISNMDVIFNLLPGAVGLCGSDYISTGEVPRLDERIAQGIAAARRVTSVL
jgi:hypothetical protein